MIAHCARLEREFGESVKIKEDQGDLVFFIDTGKAEKLAPEGLEVKPEREDFQDCPACTGFGFYEEPADYGGCTQVDCPICVGRGKIGRA